MGGSVRNTPVSIPRSRLVIAVLILAAMLAGGVGAEAATLPLTWDAPTTNANGTPLTDLAGYRIYLGTSAPACPSSSFHTVSSSTTAPTPGQTVSTRITALSAGTTYFARVTAVDTSGNESACSSSASGIAQPDFSVSPTGATSFGSVAVNGTVDRTFTVQNTSTASISVTASVGSPFSIVSGGSGSLAAGASRTVTVRFQPTTSGSFAGNVNFTGNGDSISRAVSGSTTTVSIVSLSVTKNGTGTGTVTSSPVGIACGTDCGETLPVGTPVTLTAAAATGSVFAGWSGACSGTAATCSWTMSAATAVTATFNTTGAVTAGPLVSSLSPVSAVAGSKGITLTVNGSGFVATSVVHWNGVARTTTFVNARRLRAAISAADLATPGWVPVTVFTPSSDGGTSASKTFTINAPVPVAGSLSPNSAVGGGAGLTVTVNGSNFVSTSVFRWKGAARTTTYVSATQLRAQITAADLATPGSALSSVYTPTPGGGASATSMTFTINAPVPAVSSLSPASAIAGSTGFTLIVNGSGFVTTSSVRWNGSARTTTYVSATELRAAITATDLATVRSVPVTVYNPAPGGGTSTSMSFAVTTGSGSSTPPAAPGSPNVTLRSADVSGVTFDVAWSAGNGAASYRYLAAFNDGSAARQGSVTGLTTFQLRMPYHASGAAFGGFVCIRSVSATGLLSTDHSCSALAVPATPPAPPAPVASSLSPTSAVAGSSGLTLTVNGSGFVSTSVVRWNGAVRTTTFVSATQLRATISATDLAAAGSAVVSVFTPAPGGGTSGNLSFVITVPPAPSTPPAAPGNPSVMLRTVDAGGATFDITWGAASGAASYTYIAAFSDGSAAQQGSVTGTSMQLRMPYHVSGAAFGAFVCIRSVSATGLQSTDHSCSPLTVPARQ
jgi:hypothetical protein